MERQSQEIDEEINLCELWQVIVKRRKMIIFISLTIVVSITIINLLLPKTYRGEGNLSIVDGGTCLENGDTITNRIESANEIIDILGRIDNEKKILILSKTYMSVKTLKLKAFKNATDRISVEIEAKNTKDIPTAFVELVDYLNNMDSVKANINEEREILTQKAIEMSKLLESAANLTGAYEKRLAEGKLLDLGFNPIDLSKKIADIKIEKLGVDQALARLKNGRIQIMTPPYISPEPVSPKMVMNIIMAAIISLVMGIILAFFMEFLEKKKNY